MKEFKPTWLMIKVHNVTGLKYFCKTTRENPYKYNGSGVRWIKHLKKHGKNVKTVWCMRFTSMELLMTVAIEFSHICGIVDSEHWANLVVEDGMTGWPPGTKHTDESKKKCGHTKGFQKGCIPHNKGVKENLSLKESRMEKIKQYRESTPGWDNAFRQGQRNAEEKRRQSVKTRMTGVNNWNYDSTLYTFHRAASGETVTMTRTEFMKTKCNSRNVHQLVTRKRATVSGWALLSNPVTI